jgi:hypothetical protein
MGCTPGFWKAPQHFDSWPAPYTPTTLLNTVFDLNAGGFNYNNLNGVGAVNDSLLDALNYQGGSTLQGAAEILLRAGVSAVLNAQSGIGYPLNVTQIVTAVNAALATGDRTTIINLANQLNAFNNLPCPLS